MSYVICFMQDCCSNWVDPLRNACRGDKCLSVTVFDAVLQRIRVLE